MKKQYIKPMFDAVKVETSSIMTMSNFKVVDGSKDNEEIFSKEFGQANEKDGFFDAW